MLSHEFISEYTFTKRVPNERYIVDLIEKVEQYPGIWKQIVSKVKDVSGYNSSWIAANSLLEFLMKAPHRVNLQAWLDDRLLRAKKLLAGSNVMGAAETLESACKALIVYDSITPPKHGARSDAIMTMNPDEVKYRSTNHPVRLPDNPEKNPIKYLAIQEEAAPLLFAAREFNEFIGKLEKKKTDSDRSRKDKKTD